MKIKSLGFKVTDEESGIVFELIPKTEAATQELVEKFFDSFQVLKVEAPKVETPKVELLKEEKKPAERSGKLAKKPKFVQSKPEKKGIPTPIERQTKELGELPEEFVIADIGELFESEGYDKKKILENAYHDIQNLMKKNKIISVSYTHLTLPTIYSV